MTEPEEITKKNSVKIKVKKKERFNGANHKTIDNKKPQPLNKQFIKRNIINLQTTNQRKRVTNQVEKTNL